MTEEAFREVMEQVLTTLPEIFTSRLRNLTFEVEDWHPDQSEESEELVLGTFHGFPLTEQSWRNDQYPSRIVLYREALTASCSSLSELRSEIRATLLHEIAHYFGISDERLHELEAY